MPQVGSPFQICKPQEQRKVELGSEFLQGLLWTKLPRSPLAAMDQLSPSRRKQNRLYRCYQSTLPKTLHKREGRVHYIGKPPLQMLAVARAERIDTMADAQRRRVEPSKVFLSFQSEAGVLAITRLLF